MMNTKRRKLYAAKLRNNLLARWDREQQDKKRRAAQQADLMKWALRTGKTKSA